MKTEKAVVKPFNLLSIDTATACENVVKFEVLDAATGEGTGLLVHLKGEHSAQYIKARSRIESSNTIAWVNYNRLALGSSKRDQPAVSPEKQLDNEIELLASVTCGLSTIAGDEELDYWMLGNDGIKFSRENIEMIYRRFPDIRKQVDAWVVNLAVFMKSKPNN